VLHNRKTPTYRLSFCPHSCVGSPEANYTLRNLLSQVDKRMVPSGRARGVALSVSLTADGQRGSYQLAHWISTNNALVSIKCVVPGLVANQKLVKNGLRGNINPTLKWRVRLSPVPLIIVLICLVSPPRVPAKCPLIIEMVGRGGGDRICGTSHKSC
jgi:hypothetical protein